MRRGPKRGHAKFCDAGRGTGLFVYWGRSFGVRKTSERQGYDWDELISLEGGIFIVLILEGWSLSLL